jgi:E3 ubiquitin-protein ligase MARCH6
MTFVGGVVLMLVSHTLLDISYQQWTELMTANSVGAYALAWVAGITFMLSVTISVLQLREVLHPSIFGKLIKPQVSIV